MEIDLTQFLVAIIDSQDGEVRIPYATFVEDKGEKALTIDFEEDGAVLVLRLVNAEEVPDDVTD